MPIPPFRNAVLVAIPLLLAGVALAGTAAPEGAAPRLFDPYANESEVLAIGPDLTVENRLDRVTVIGSIDLTLDREGAARAEALRALLERVCRALEEREPLPARVATAPETAVDNPFE